MMGIEIEPPVRRGSFKGIFGMAEFLEEGPIRKFIREWKPILPREKLLKEFFGEPSPPVLIGGEWVDAEIDRMIEEKQKEWRTRGYTENQIRMATDLAKGWISKMSEAFAPEELKSAVAKHITPKALEVADSWLKKIAGSRVI